jgi:YesN/AraC family two-component response regulator
VDDDRSVREVISLALQDVCDVRHAATGRDAVHIVGGGGIAAVVLDHRLPDCAGLDVLSKMKAFRPELPVIMVTGYGSEMIGASALKLGIQDYFRKPFNVFQLRESVLHSMSCTAGGRPQPAVDCDGAAWEPSATDGGFDVAIRKAATVIQQRYWDHLTLPDLAREVGMSKYRLSHKFHEVMGVTLRGYLLGARIEKAKELLRGTRIQVTEIALAVGFGDLPRFDKLFKRHTGLSPSAYRAQSARDQ